MLEDYQSNNIFPDVRWTIVTALGSLGLLSLVLFLCAKKDKKEKRAEQTNGTSNSSTHPGSTKDVHIDIIPQFVTTAKSDGVHKYESTVIIPQQQAQHPNSNSSHHSNNNAPQRGSGSNNHHQGAEKLSRKERDDSKKNNKKKEKTKERDKKLKVDKMGPEKRHSARIERKDESEREKYKKKRKSDSAMHNIDVPPSIPAPVPESVPQPAPAAPSEFSSLPLPSVPIKVSELDAYLRDAQKSGEISKQYKAIPRSMGYTTEESEKPAQREKNRYRNIVPYDYNRIKLDTIPNDPHSHYINASLIDDEKKNKKFIAAQGPIEPTIVDFWRMIWEEEVNVVVMVTNPWEKGMKCLMYWPEGNDTRLQYGDIEIFLEKKDVSCLPEYTIRKITAKRGDKQRQITQLQFRSWPDHGVPRHGMALLSFRDKVRSEIVRLEQQNINTPVLIHCSAGVGRTGTFLAIDQLLDQAEEEKIIDVPACVCTLRKQRSDLVQTVEQYGFIYQAVLEYLVLGQTTIPCYKFEECYNNLTKQGKSGKSKLQKQFQMLDQFMAEKSATNIVALEEENRSKNRSSEVLPTDEVRRVKLLSHFEGRSNYINAVFADGHRRSGSFIATEAPLSNTIIDFWRMIQEYQCSIIIMLTPVKNLQMEELYFPLAVGDVQQIPPFQIECTEKKDSQGIEIRKLRISDKREKREIYHMTLSSELQVNAEEILEKMQALYDKMVRWQQSHQDPSSSHARPVVAHCLNGIQWTGLFIVLCHLMDQINNDQEVDIFNAVRQSRLTRSQFIATEEQYVTLHDIVKLYIDSFETYSNFK